MRVAGSRGWRHQRLADLRLGLGRKMFLQQSHNVMVESLLNL